MYQSISFYIATTISIAFISLGVVQCTKQVGLNKIGMSCVENGGTWTVQKYNRVCIR